jgi:SAM-dependent methyltransferase
MDAENPTFEPESFDTIVTRNLTSFLPNLPEAYKKWHSLLRKGGILINFDGDYYHDHSHAPLPENHAHKDLTAEQNAAYAHIESEMRALQQPRPKWDMALLAGAGFHDCRVDRDCYHRIYCEIDKFYNPTPIFCITARK